MTPQQAPRIILAIEHLNYPLYIALAISENFLLPILSFFMVSNLIPNLGASGNLGTSGSLTFSRS
jgi:hypothetical protein